jgi:hypothetical protein
MESNRFIPPATLWRHAAAMASAHAWRFECRSWIRRINWSVD